MPPSRRTFLRATGAAAALAAVPALAACGAPADAGAPRLRVAFPGRGPLGVPDAHVVPQVIDRARAVAVAETLTVWTAEMGVGPGLAETVEPDATGTRWRVRLAPATCHDGRPITADDVLASLGRIVAGGTAAPFLAGVDPARTRALSASELEIGLTAPDFLFPLALGAPGTGIVRDGRGAAPVGTGPFRVVPGTPDVLARHDGYRGGPPPSSELEFVAQDDEEQRYQDLIAGRIAWAHDLFPHSARRIASRVAVSLLRAPGSVNRLLDLRTDRPPFDDPRLREAVRITVNRDELVRRVLLDLGSPGDDFYGPGLREHVGGAAVLRDPERARELVDAAGARDTEFEVWFEDPLSRPAMPLLVEQLDAIGLRALPRDPNPPDDAKDRTGPGSGAASGVGAGAGMSLRPTTDTPAMAFRRVDSVPVPLYLAVSAAGTPATAPSPEVAALLAGAKRSADPDVRSDALRRAQVILRGSTTVWAVGDELTGAAADLTGATAARPDTDRWARFDRARLG
ncbi:ABC transporter substrate-binding protein [Pseudonocardia nantongensis]|uniref:ABC transporter substrate-binding protein n=1 Tax=Pseudonocardia nantongensis TaxID=1181885 RepID=UPI00397D80D2